MSTGYLGWILALLLGTTLGAVLDNTITGGDSIEWSGCANREDLFSCLGVRAVAALDRAARMADIDLVPGVTLVKEKDVRAGRALMTPTEIEESLPEERTARSEKLLDLMYDSILRFLQSHSLNIKFPENAPETLQRAIDEGRGKMKKKFLPILMLVGVKLLALLPLALGVIGLMALKALFVGKLAFILAAIFAFQKFFQGGANFGGFSKQVPESWSGGSSGWSTGSSSSGPYYRRSLNSHDLAYAAQVPQTETNAQ